MFYQPVLDQRFFSADKLYSDVDWSNFGAVIDGFEIRMNDWYVTPGKMIRQASWNHAFAVMAMDCLLIDTLSQYYFGESSSSKTAFSDFAKLALPPFAAALPQPIRKDPSSTRPKVPYTTFADVLYSCFRCGILHEAHVALCGGVASLGGAMVDIAPVVSTRYDDGSGCPTVRLSTFKGRWNDDAIFRAGLRRSGAHQWCARRLASGCSFAAHGLLRALGRCALAI